MSHDQEEGEEASEDMTCRSGTAAVAAPSAGNASTRGNQQDFFLKRAGESHETVLPLMILRRWFFLVVAEVFPDSGRLKSVENQKGSGAFCRSHFVGHALLLAFRIPHQWIELAALFSPVYRFADFPFLEADQVR